MNWSPLVQFCFYWKSLFSSMLRLDFCFILVGESVTGTLSLHLVDILRYRIYVYFTYHDISVFGLWYFHFWLSMDFDAFQLFSLLTCHTINHDIWMIQNTLSLLPALTISHNTAILRFNFIHVYSLPHHHSQLFPSLARYIKVPRHPQHSTKDNSH